MPDFITNALNKFGEFYGGLTFARKLATVGLAVVVVAGISGMFIFAGRTTYVPLMNNLTPEDSTAVIRYLRDKKIPFIMDETGKSISVPPEKVYDLRLELSSSGMAQSGVVGYEVFDKQSFGATSTVQRINEQRALEGELVRTINHIKGVERSRVHLAIPAKSAFLEEEKQPTASVILDIVPGVNLGEEQVRGIQQLVAAAVKGLDLNSVTIISNSGKQLSQNNSDPAAAFSAAAMDYQRKYERKMEGKIEEILARVVGDGKVVARVNADFDFSRMSETETLFDGENAVARSTNRDVDKMTGTRPLPTGTPGARAQVPGADGQLQPTQPLAVNNNTDRNREVVNYEIPKTVRNKEKPMAELKRLSVAVMLDSAKVPDAAAPGGYRTEQVSAEKLAEMRSLVANAVGWNDKRDPGIEIKNMPFYREDMEAATAAAAAVERKRMIEKIVQWAAIGLIFTFFFIFVVRPFIKWLTENTMDSVEDFLPKTIEELERAQSASKIPGMEDVLPEIEEKVDPEKVQGEMLKEKVLALINDNPHKASQVLREWIHIKAASKADNKTA